MKPEILHLYNRLAFGIRPEAWKQRAGETLEQARQALFKTAHSVKPLPAPVYDIPAEGTIDQMSEEQRKALRREMDRLTDEVNWAWLQQMAEGERGLVEKMTLFWHGHFACESKLFHLALAQNNTLRQHALGNFRDLLLAIAKDPSMILYLNNQQNRKKSPNENFARELMELFTLGRGHYTEQDIKEAARAFTGWFADRRTAQFAFEERAHDTGTKTFMGRTGNWDGGDIIDILLEQEQVAIFIAQKVYRFFVNDQPNTQHINTLAKTFRDAKYDILTLMKTLASADFFYAPENRANKIAAPIELIVRYEQWLGLTFGSAKDAILMQRMLGQVLFAPPNVAGWAGGKAWIDNATLLLRLHLPTILFNNTDIDYKSKDDPEDAEGKERVKRLAVQLQLQPILDALRPIDTAAWGQWLLSVPYTYSGSAVEQWVMAAEAVDPAQRALLGFLSIPEFQLW